MDTRVKPAYDGFGLSAGPFSDGPKTPAFVNPCALGSPRLGVSAYGHDEHGIEPSRHAGRRPAVADRDVHDQIQRGCREIRGFDAAGWPARAVDRQSWRWNRRQPQYISLNPCGSRRHRRLDQLERVVAGPFRGSGDIGDLAALAVDEYRGRHAQRFAYGFKILKNLGFLVAEIAEPGQIGVFEEGFRLFRIAGVDVDRNHLEILAPKLGLQAVQRRHLLTTGHAPGGPQIDQHGLAAP